MIKRAIAASLALAACAAPAAPACKVIAPADLAGGAATWTGPCAKGRAHGVGALRVARGAGSPGLFFGRMVQGRPYSGVMPTQEGDWRPAWRFDAQLRPRDDPANDRQSSIDTFDVAAAGAAEASRRHRAAGNQASARFYAEQSRRLADALD